MESRSASQSDTRTHTYIHTRSYTCIDFHVARHFTLSFIIVWSSFMRNIAYTAGCVPFYGRVRF